MKVVFERQSLASSLALVHNVVSSTTTMPILSNVLIEAAGEEVVLSGTDLESFGQVRIKANVEEGGRATASARLLTDIVRLLPDGDVNLETAGNRMTIRAARNTYALTTMPVDDFPDWPKVEPQLTIVLRQADLKRALHNTTFAIPTRDPRKVLMGVLFDVAEGKLTCVATDGRKLGKSIIEPVEIIGGSSIQAILPERILTEIDHAIGEEGEIRIAFAERQVVFSLSNLTYISNRIEGTYPKYEAVIPQTFKRTIKVQKTILSDAISRAAILAERKHHSIVLHFTNGQIEINARSFEDGSYEGSVETDYDGEPFRIAFNYQYLQEIFKVAPDAVIEMKMKEAAAPVVFECESDPDSLYLIMPVRMTDIDDVPQPAAAGAVED
ncbi:MAG TPA: DNA polymerase III subunit beta [Candidatus Sumerlaeota bacterium]|nr:MAG: DNA polymerase III subunit beta [candidate division BRC1 bacterium ADurb.BinA292]HOE97192.1 DNA polymerase III subunit beta [Candidatus Sumerlaeota bacterium]HOR28816.1 DNA polymerase III subunit beta [Candidatus Sumerlaeota bacterium]HPK03899.1 DNA polymerase III subunit beta [Candidatus Sumerlaeota bacterium]